MNSSVEQAKARMIELVREGGKCSKYTDEALVRLVACCDQIGVRAARQAFLELVRDGRLGFQGNYGMVVLKQGEEALC